MLSYLASFIFYTLGMIGILLIGFVVYKKMSPIEKGNNKGVIKILDSLPIGNKKVLLVVKIKNEKFLIASGLEHTTFLSKLDDENQISKRQVKIQTKKPNNSEQIQGIGQIAQQIQENSIKLQNLNQNQTEKPIQNETQAWNNIQQGAKNVEVANLENFRNVIQTQLENEQEYKQEDELKTLRLQKLQKKFDDLYYKDEVVKKTSPIEKDNQKNLMQKLLKELSSEKNYKSGNVING